MRRMGDNEKLHTQHVFQLGKGQGQPLKFRERVGEYVDREGRRSAIAGVHTKLSLKKCDETDILALHA